MSIFLIKRKYNWLSLTPIFKGAQKVHPIKRLSFQNFRSRWNWIFFSSILFYFITLYRKRLKIFESESRSHFHLEFSRFFSFEKVSVFDWQTNLLTLPSYLKMGFDLARLDWICILVCARVSNLFLNLDSHYYSISHKLKMAVTVSGNNKIHKIQMTLLPF